MLQNQTHSERLHRRGLTPSCCGSGLIPTYPNRVPLPHRGSFRQMRFLQRRRSAKPQPTLPSGFCCGLFLNCAGFEPAINCKQPIRKITGRWLCASGCRNPVLTHTHRGNPRLASYKEKPQHMRVCRGFLLRKYRKMDEADERAELLQHTTAALYAHCAWFCYAGGVCCFAL